MQKSVLCVVSGTFVAANVWLNFFFFWEETGNCGCWSTACEDRLVTLRWNWYYCLQWLESASSCCSPRREPDFWITHRGVGEFGTWTVSFAEKSWDLVVFFMVITYCEEDGRLGRGSHQVWYGWFPHWKLSSIFCILHVGEHLCYSAVPVQGWPHDSLLTTTAQLCNWLWSLVCLIFLWSCLIINDIE